MSVGVLIAENLDWARGVARSLARHMPTRHDRDDLVSEGVVGLCQAARTYRPGMGPFRGHAYMRIRGAVLDFAREDHMVRPSADDRRKFRKRFPVDPLDATDNMFRDAGASPEAQAVAGDLVAAVASRAKPKARRLLLDRLAGGTSQETCDRLGVSSPMATRWLYDLRRIYGELVAA